MEINFCDCSELNLNVHQNWDSFPQWEQMKFKGYQQAHNVEHT